MPDDPRNHDRLLWAALGMLLLLVLVSGGIVIGSLFMSPGTDSTVKEMIEGRILARAIVLFMIIPCIFVLTAQDKITGEAALAALSAIAGYILGGTAALR